MSFIFGGARVGGAYIRNNDTDESNEILTAFYVYYSTFRVVLVFGSRSPPSVPSPART